MSSAIIIVRYQLSKAGIATALRHGRNCDRNQTIVLQSPDYEAPKPPQDALEEIVGGVSGVEAPQGAEAATAVLNKMIEVTQSLAKALNPFASDDVIVEQADDEIWEIACEMASTNRGQTPVINIHDDDHDRKVVGDVSRFVGDTKYFAVAARLVVRAVDLGGLQRLIIDLPLVLEFPRFGPGTGAVKRDMTATEDHLVRASNGDKVRLVLVEIGLPKERVTLLRSPFA